MDSAIRRARWTQIPGLVSRRFRVCKACQLRRVVGNRNRKPDAGPSPWAVARLLLAADRWIEIWRQRTPTDADGRYDPGVLCLSTFMSTNHAARNRYEQDAHPGMQEHSESFESGPKTGKAPLDDSISRKKRSSPRLVQETARPEAPAGWSTRALPVLQRLSERFISAHVGTERAGFSFEPSETKTDNAETDIQGLSSSSSLSSANEHLTGASPSKRHRNVWEKVFHPGGRSYPGKSQFDTDDSSAAGEPTGQSISEIYSRRFSAEQQRTPP